MEKIIKDAELVCGRLGIEEVYKLASKNANISNEAIEACEWTPEWIDKFIAIADKGLARILMENVEMTFEQFATVLKKAQVEDRRERPEDYPAQNSDARFQISRHYPFTPEQEAILKPYCEYDIFMHSLKVEPTYEKVIAALSNKYIAYERHMEIGEAIAETILTEEQQLEILKKAPKHVMAQYLNEIANGLVENKNLSAETVIAMCTMSDVQDGLLSLFGYGDLDMKLINLIATMQFTEDQKSKLKKASTYSAFDGAIKREDFTFDDFIDMLKNNCNHTSVGIQELVLRFIAVPEGDKYSNNRVWNNENELRLSQTGLWLSTHTLLEANNPNSLPETLICFAKRPLDCSSDRYNCASYGKDELLQNKIKNTILTDEEFDLLLQTANGFEHPTNPHVVRERDLGDNKNWNEFYKTIPEEDRDQYLKDCKPYNNQVRWTISVNTGLIEQKDLSFARLCKILETAKISKVGVRNESLSKIINTRVYTTEELEIMITLGFNSLQAKLEEQKANPDIVPTPAKLAIVNFENKTFELPTGENPIFYVVDIKEGHYDSEGNHLSTKRVYLPTACNGIRMKDKTAKFYPVNYEETETWYNYANESGRLSSWDDGNWQYNYGDKTIDGAVILINTSQISERGNQLILRNQETPN